MVEIRENKLVFSFPDVHKDAVFSIDFQRTLRIPDDNKEHSLPPGLGNFEIEHVEDHAAKLPALWNERGGIMLPMYQADALWLKFTSGIGYSASGYPFAVKIAAGKINAVTGGQWQNELEKDPQDYVVVPGQPWLDGFCVQKGLIRQFVAMPLGQGYTAEEQIAGTAEHGGIQIIVYPMKLSHYEALKAREIQRRSDKCNLRSPFLLPILKVSYCTAMGIAPGGLMRQSIGKDKHGINAWDMSNPSRCFVHILNSTQWSNITGKPMPIKQLRAAAYTKAGLPWFKHYDDKLVALNGGKKLSGLDSVAAKGIKLGQQPLPENDSVTPQKIVKLGPTAPKVTDGMW